MKKEILITLYRIIVKDTEALILGIAFGLMGLILVTVGGVSNFDLQHIIMKVFGAVLIIMATGKLTIAYFKQKEPKEVDEWFETKNKEIKERFKEKTNEKYFH